MMVEDIGKLPNVCRTAYSGRMPDKEQQKSISLTHLASQMPNANYIAALQLGRFCIASYKTSAN
jgi:6-phosphogluconolactonase (cycloisomerase 2 family)